MSIIIMSSDEKMGAFPVSGDLRYAGWIATGVIANAAIKHLCGRIFLISRTQHLHYK